MRIKVLLATFLFSLGLFVTNAQAVKYWGDTLLTDEAVDFKEQASSPTNPSTDRWKLYFKSDGSVYKLDESGVETELASKASEIQDSDGDTKIQTEEGADDDTIRFDAAGSEVGAWTSSLLTTTTPLTVGGEVKTTGIEDADGDTAVKVEESADEDIIRFDVLGSQAGRIDTTGWMLKGNDVSGDGPLHIGAGLAGSVTANSNADDGIFEGAGHTGVSIIGGNAESSNLYFGDTDSNQAGTIRYTHNNDIFVIGRNNGNEIQLRSGAIFFNGGDANVDIRIRGDGSEDIFFSDASVGNSGMGTTSPDASALLDMVSTTKGLGVPSMTTTQRDAITTPRDGLMVYDETSDAVSVRANGSWVDLSTATGVTWTNSGAIDLTSGSPTSVSLLSGLPSGVSEIDIYITGVSTDTNNQAPMLQLGDSGGLETSGYNGFADYHDASTDAGTANSSGFLLAEETRFDAGNSGIFLVRLKHMGSNFWAMESAVGNRNGTGQSVFVAIGDKTLSDVLTQLTITTSGGTATFDGGTAYVRHR